jgi:hypothetical protein
MKISTALSVLMPKNNTFGAKIIGHAWYASLNKETILKAELWKGNYTDYAGLRLTMLNKQYGQIDTAIIPFPAYTTPSGYSVPKMLTPCMNPMDKVKWDPVLTTEELRDIHAQVNEYIELFGGREA